MPYSLRPYRSVFLMGSLLLILVATLCVRTWQQMQHERLNRALYQAVEQGNTQQVQVLLKVGADPNVREHPAQMPHGVLAWFRWLVRRSSDKTSGVSALMTACDKEQEDIVRLLLKAGADVNIHCLDDLGKPVTTLSYANFSEEPHSNRILALLLDAGANPNQIDSAGESLLDKAVSCDAETINLLIAHGATFDSHSEHARILAFNAAYNSDAGVLKALLDKGVRTDIPTQDGSLLNNAAAIGNVNVVKLLQSRGADLNYKDENGTTALCWAEIYKRRFLARGATQKQVANYDMIIAFLKAHGGRDK